MNKDEQEGRGGVKTQESQVNVLFECPLATGKKFAEIFSVFNFFVFVSFLISLSQQ